MSDSVLKVKIHGETQLYQALRGLKITEKKRKIIHGQMARKVLVYSRKRIRLQRNIDGSTYEERADGSRKKMLKKILSNKHAYAWGLKDRGEVGFRKKRTGHIGAAHQEGVKFTYTKAKALKALEKAKPDYKAPATRKQARRLKQLGYKKPGKGATTLKWIQANLNQGQAGFLIRLLKKDQPKQRWDISLPKRSFLGVDDNERQELLELANKLVLKLVLN